MNPIVQNVLYIAITVLAVPVATFLCALLKKKTNEITQSLENNKLQDYINGATDAVTQAVLTVSQTFVDSLKAKGEFTADAANEAKNEAINIAKALITEDAKQAIIVAKGDFDVWLNTLIEATVKENK